MIYKKIDSSAHFGEKMGVAATEAPKGSGPALKN